MRNVFLLLISICLQNNAEKVPLPLGSPSAVIGKWHVIGLHIKGSLSNLLHTLKYEDVKIGSVVSRLMGKQRRSTTVLNYIISLLQNTQKEMENAKNVTKTLMKDSFFHYRKCKAYWKMFLKAII